ncbi:MAG: biotin/lipoyl-binding protein [Myxococcales bacterium]|nr:biotin/lipoyl-binding protein [Myxococcales bacterium]
MTMTSVLVANRGEVAIRIMRAASELGLRSVAIHPADDETCLHTRKADSAHRIPGAGAAAYLDAEALVNAAIETGCDALHPGWGFLSENPELARRCTEAGLTFVGPTPEVLELFGDKVRARALAEACDVPVLEGSRSGIRLDEARDFLASLGPGAAIMVKALAGGGGRGMRAVTEAGNLGEAFERCRSEAEKAFGNGELYVERLLPNARHLEIQILGDRAGEVTHLGERDCTLQRRHQKLVEIAPSPILPASARDALTSAAVRMARRAGCSGLATFEFLSSGAAFEQFAFIEANPRLQVEHTVTEEVTGIDLVQTQLRLAAGSTLTELGLRQEHVPAPRGYAIQVRVNAESWSSEGELRPSAGTLHAFDPPTGPGLRTDTLGYAGYSIHSAFDSLLAKCIAHSPSGSFESAAVRLERALREFRIEGVATNLGLLRALVAHPRFLDQSLDTRFVEENAHELAREPGAPLYFESPEAQSPLAGARLDSSDPLAVLEHGRRSDPAPSASPKPAGPPGSVPVAAPLQGTVVSVEVSEGDPVDAGQPLLVMEAMKMEHVIDAPCNGTVTRLEVSAGDAVPEAHALAFLEPGPGVGRQAERTEAVDLERIRPDLAESLDRHRAGLDEARPRAVARRRKTGQRTARENVSDLCDADSFREYGPLVIAAQRRRRALDDLIENTPADGMITGIGTVNASQFGEDAARCAVLSYDYTVLAGTQGLQNHRKKDRLFELAEQWRLPVVILTEGGGGRPGDTDGSGVAGLDCLAFQYFGRLSGRVPLVGLNSGRCFAGNAALLGCCDVVIATANSNIGMGGPAMVEGGGLGVFRPEEIGPMEVQVPNGVVDIAVADEAEGVEAARRYLSYFQGTLPEWTSADPRRLRSLIPENRLRIYDVRTVIDTLADIDSVLELRRGFGHGMVTSLARVEGRPIGIIANNPTHLAGAIDSDGADKAARFMQLCDAFGIPILFLCDTPGIMVGPEAEKSGTVRHAARMFVVGASLTVPFFTIVLRKGYGLGAQAMAGGSFRAPFFTVAWPTGEFGGMGLEGAVKLGYRKELEAVEDPEERRVLYQQMVDRMYEHGKAVNMASHFEIDEVIDPFESRAWIMRALRAAPPEAFRGGQRSCVDTW